MGCNVVQCNACKQFSWEGVKTCEHCGSGNLTIGFHQLLEILGIKQEAHNGKPSTNDSKL